MVEKKEESNEVLECLYARRTYRIFKDQQIEQEKLDQIIKAGLLAPNAGGRQGPVFVVCQDRTINALLGEAKRKASQIPPGRFVSREQPSVLDDLSIRSSFYGAPVLITIAAPKNFIFSESDAAIAGENMIIAATSLGVGSCFIAKAEATFATDIGAVIWKDWNIDARLKPFCHVLLGYPDGPIPKPKQIKANRVIHVS